eukprot:SAG22_NODE_14517_length_372_cov_1.315018_1_plen_80_part_10
MWPRARAAQRAAALALLLLAWAPGLVVRSELESLSFHQLNMDGDACWERAEVESFVRSLSSTEFDDAQEVETAAQKILGN